MDKPTTWEELPLLLSVEEVSKLLGYNQARIRELCRANIIPSIRLARAYKIPRDNLKNWIQKAAEQPQQYKIK